MLRKDQEYQLNVSKALKSGTCKEDLVLRDSGYLSRSSWLKKANRTLRLFISEESPSPELQEQVLFILKSHIPMWFTIKTSKHFTGGSKLIFQAIQYTRYLSKPFLNVFHPVIKGDGFFANPEHLQLAINQDAKKSIRKFGLRRILREF